MGQFVVVMSDHKRPRYYVARKMIGKQSYAVIATAQNEYNARSVTEAMNAQAAISIERNVVPIKTRKRA